MDDNNDMKEKAHRLSDNYNEIVKFVANKEKKNSDDYLKGGTREDYEQDSKMDFKGYQRGKRSRGRSNRPMRERSFNINHQNFNKSRNNFELSNDEDYPRSWHEGYRPKSSPSTSNVSSSQRNMKSNNFRRNTQRSYFSDEKLLPLMSDSESSMDKKSNVSRMSCYKDVTAQDLITVLSQNEKFSATLLHLLDKYEYNHKEVKVIVEKHYKIFELNGETVILKPKVKICKAHLEMDGCSNRNNCLDLHICPKYIHNICESDHCCLMGHSWKTNHNQEILKTHLICSLQVPILNNLFMSLMLGDCILRNDLQICLDYNESECRKVDCNKLHLCLYYLAKLCPSDNRTTCQLNHNVLSKDISPILLSNGISVNESPRDIIFSINSCPAIKQEIEKCIESISIASPLVSELKVPEEDLSKDISSASDIMQNNKELESESNNKELDSESTNKVDAKKKKSKNSLVQLLIRGLCAS